MRPSLLTLFAALWLAPTALAASAPADDEEDKTEEDKTEEAPEDDGKKKDLDDEDADVFGEEDDDLMIQKVERIETADQLQNLDQSVEKDTATDTFRDEEGDEIDLLGEETAKVPMGPGADSDQIYRTAVSKYASFPPDEEVAAWDAYLLKYNNTAYRKRIEDRTSSLMEGMYGPREAESSALDLQDKQIGFSQALLLENIDPRTRLQAAFEWGIPDYFNLALDYEHALSRRFSVHAGIRRRYSGWSLEPGVHWALVKSTRTKTILTFIGDTHVNTNPAFFGLRPQLAFGKQIAKLDLQAQLGPDITLGTSTVGVGLVGGAAATYLASDTVALFLESAVTAKNFAWEGGVFQFDTATFGMKFFPTAGDRRRDEINAGATVPVVSRYWQFHYGSLSMQYNHYFE